MRKSSDLSRRYLPGTSRPHGSLASFREQMADYAKGALLQELRRTKGMSRENVAAEIGVTTKTLYSWEKQNSAIKWENAKRVATFYDVEPEDLVTRDTHEAAGLPSRAQLDRIETKLDALLGLAFGETTPDALRAELEAELEARAQEELRGRRPGDAGAPSGRGQGRPRRAR